MSPVETMRRLLRVAAVTRKGEPKDETDERIIHYAFMAERDIRDGIFDGANEQQVLHLAASRTADQREQKSKHGATGGSATATVTDDEAARVFDQIVASGTDQREATAKAANRLGISPQALRTRLKRTGRK